MKFLSVVIGIILLISGCSSTQNNTKETTPRNPKTVEIGHETSLLNMIQRLPGVTVYGSGANVTIRVFTGVNSFGDKSDPLFLVNGIDYGYSYQNIESSIDVFSIESVTVYKSAAEIAPYGVRGGNGVINIVLK